MGIGTVLGLIAVGLVTGTITSLVGASGVMVVVPALTMIFRMNAHTAIGSSLLVDVITSAVVAIGYFRAKNVRLKEGLWIAVASILGAFVGARWAGSIPEGPLTLVFAIVMIISGIATLINAAKKSTDADDGKEEGAKKQKGPHFDAAWQQILALLLVGFAIGIISGLVGAGGGVMVLLALIFILRYPMHEAVGTSTVIMAITALASTIGYGAQGSIDYKASLLIALGAVVAGIIGARFANKIDERRLKQIVSVVFIVIGVVMAVMKIVQGL